MIEIVFFLFLAFLSILFIYGWKNLSTLGRFILVLFFITYLQIGSEFFEIKDYWVICLYFSIPLIGLLNYAVNPFKGLIFALGLVLIYYLPEISFLKLKTFDNLTQILSSTFIVASAEEIMHRDVIFNAYFHEKSLNGDYKVQWKKIAIISLLFLLAHSRFNISHFTFSLIALIVRIKTGGTLFSTLSHTFSNMLFRIYY